MEAGCWISHLQVGVELGKGKDEPNLGTKQKNIISWFTRCNWGWAVRCPDHQSNSEDDERHDVWDDEELDGIDEG
jgi:hypothetical protein